uniref:Family with sequence similarity 217 member B n=1 Tax=Salvator merianae TaxID=96440 RepID=A0A8D0C152_SALMN
MFLLLPKRTTDKCTSSHRPSRLKKEPLLRKENEVGQSKIPSAWIDYSRADNAQSFCCKQEGNWGGISTGHSEGREAYRSLYEGASADAMFLDFESIRIMKEDSDQDSASDLSDSERIPIPPSPCTPPALNLRAEEIDPLSFEDLFDAKFKQPDYYYPDFLPPPFNTWDLKELATYVNTECRSEPRPEPAGVLEKYVDRLLELEWLQMHTIQAEKGKAAKSRPQTAPSVLRTLKSPGKSKVLPTALSNKQTTPQESFPRLFSSHSTHRRDLCGERTSQVLPCEGLLKRGEVACGLSAHGRRPCEVRNETKKRPTAKQQFVNIRPSESNSMIQGAGNIRPPKQSSSLYGSATPLKGLPAYTCTNPKKNGNANNYGPSRKALADKKLKANGLKQAPCKLK